ncbi:MAG TPA: YkvA family protein [Pseudolabrys sp.]|nr:YkvA family protein [Pseudolabrys sp.]
MGFAHSAFWQRNDDESAFRDQFWRKTRSVAASIPFAEDLLAAYYCAFDHKTPLPVKTALIGALAYFVLPADIIPDVLPVVGFTDDAAVLAATVNLVASHIRPEHRDAAKNKLAAFAES